eukprot:TRINITY_DN2720_c1_g1_i7.p9 TRINITY_DN2720_c1_g1~~TRINITY_DN2720_c1_g1_i7.p9  ORF type:complete len:107 (-),score=12.86 TRINITY_DN2720_c1_g1_i7:886-1206(-)
MQKLPKQKTLTNKQFQQVLLWEDNNGCNNNNNNRSHELTKKKLIKNELKLASYCGYKNEQWPDFGCEGIKVQGAGGRGVFVCQGYPQPQNKNCQILSFFSGWFVEI